MSPAHDAAALAEEPTARPRVEPSGLGGWLARSRSDAWTDLTLTVPIFALYHLGVVSLDVRNAADPLTGELSALARHNVWLYFTLTAGIAAVLVSVLLTLGHKERFETWRFGLVAFEGLAYAVLVRFAAAWVVGALPLGGAAGLDAWEGFVISLGAGFYEELFWRAGLFGVGALVLRWLVKQPARRFALVLLWALVSAAAFSGWHHLGELGDPWDARVFAFRTVCGAFFVGIFALRGFATAVFTHTLYDVWVLVL